MECVIMLQEMPPGLKEKNENPRALGAPASKTTKKRLADMVDDPSIFRTARAERASIHIRQLLDVALARSHKPRAYVVFLDRLPSLTAKAAEEADDEELEMRRYECLPPISGHDVPPNLCI